VQTKHILENQFLTSQLFNALEGKKRVSKDNGFLYEKNKKGEWRLVLPTTFDMNGKNYLEATIKEAYDAMVHGGVENVEVVD